MLLNDDRKKDVVPRTAWNRTRRNEMSRADNLVKELSNVSGLKLAKIPHFLTVEEKFFLPTATKRLVRGVKTNVNVGKDRVRLLNFSTANIFKLVIICKLNLSCRNRLNIESDGSIIRVSA